MLIKKTSNYINSFTNIKQIPSMLSAEELKFLYFYSLQQYSGLGWIVDLGCRFGASTLYICKGLEINKRINFKESKIFVSDLFEWDHECEYQLADIVDKDYYKNNGYLNLFKDNLKDYLENIEIQVDLLNGWKAEPIEFLFIDAMKNLDTTQQVLKSFYPFLIPNKTLIYQQDFDHYLTPWVHVISFMHRNYMRVYRDLAQSGGTCFILKEKIPDNLLDFDFYTIEKDVIDKSFEYAKSITNKSKHRGISAAHVMSYILRNDKKYAFEIWCKYLYYNYELSGELKELQKYFQN